MSAAALFLGFLAVGIPWANRLGRMDPEPDMAMLSLYILGLFASIASLVAFLATSSKWRPSPSIIVSFGTGIVTAAIFYASLNFGLRVLGLWQSLCLGLVASVVVAALAPFVSTSVGPNKSLHRTRKE